MSIGERVFWHRERLGWTQAELADKAGISPSTLSLIESGKVPKPHIGTVRKLARALDIDLREVS